MKRSISNSRVLASLFLVATAFAQACDGDDPFVPGTLAISFDPNSGNAAPGGTVSIPVTVEGRGSFSGTPSVVVSGLPLGVTATVGDIARNGSTSTTTVTLNVASTTAAGVYPLTVVAMGEGISPVGSTYTLTVTGGTLGLALTPTTLSVAQGASGTSTVNITRTGFTGDIGLTVTGAPTGVTATLSPTTATGNSSTLTVTAANNATLGPATLTLTGTSPVAGNRTVTLPITITAAPPPASIGLTLTPAALTIAQNASSTTTIALARTSFTGDVTFVAENLPAGVTATFTPNPSTGTGAITTLQLTTSAAAAVGTSTITIRATGTGVTAVTAPLALTITQ
jgi:hypothetical protein